MATANTNVGIGVTKPKYILPVSKSNAGNITSAVNRIAAFEDNASAYIQLLIPNANESGILAGNAETLIKSGVVFQADSSISLRTGGNNGRILIAKNGNAAIGGTSPQSKLHVSNGATSGALYFPSTTSIIEPSSSSLVQLMNPSANTAAIISGTELSNSRSSIFFNPDSSVSILAGGFSERVSVSNNGNVGIAINSPVSKMHVNGSLGVAIRSITSNSGLTINDHTIIILPAATAVVVTLPAANTCGAREYVIVNKDATAYATNINYLDLSNASVNVLPATTSITIQSDGANWHRI